MNSPSILDKIALPETSFCFSFCFSSKNAFLILEKFKYSSNSLSEILHVEKNVSPTLNSENFFNSYLDSSTQNVTSDDELELSDTRKLNASAIF